MAILRFGENSNCDYTGVTEDNYLWGSFNKETMELLQQ